MLNRVQPLAPAALPAPIQLALDTPQAEPPRPIQLAALPEPQPFRGEPIRLNPVAAEPLRPDFIQAAPPPEPLRAAVARPEPRPEAMPFRQASAPLPAPPIPRINQPARQAGSIPLPPAPVYAALQPSSPAHRGFQLVSSAVAAPALHHGTGTPGSWAVQVGAFNNAGLANSATLTAREQARDVLGTAHPVVASVRQSNGILYRARLTGLSHGSATQACERLARARTSCMLVSPDAQS